MVTVLVASRTVPPLAMSAYDLVLVLPWSMCPMVPTLTCGFVLVKVSLAICNCALTAFLKSKSIRREPFRQPHPPARSSSDGHPNGRGQPLGTSFLTPEVWATDPRAAAGI